MTAVAALSAVAAAGTPRLGGAQGHDMKHMQGMAASPFGISMDRMGSGTTWIPDAVPIPSKQFMLGAWDIMAHGYAFVQYNNQSGRRGDDQFGSLNWGMLMASHTLFGGRFQARTMLSFDAATVTRRGYPLLLQSGEVYGGAPIADRQHPHDFWMELGVLYERAIAGQVALSLYAAPSGEPALGPVAFMHRPSAVEIPAAPLGHHWQDATHIAFGVVTAGLFGKQWKFEASAFNGTEPDERRWNFDHITLDSYSARATLNPNANWSLTAGFGYLKNPEADDPAESVHRFTTSALYSRTMGTRGTWTSSFVWGANREAGETTSSALFESRVTLGKNTLFTRAERVRKYASDLLIDLPDDERLNLSSVSVGYVRDIARVWGLSLGAGASGTLNIVPSSIRDVYGTRTPKGAIVFLRVHPRG